MAVGAAAPALLGICVAASVSGSVEFRHQPAQVAAISSNHAALDPQSGRQSAAERSTSCAFGRSVNRRNHASAIRGLSGENVDSAGDWVLSDPERQCDGDGEGMWSSAGNRKLEVREWTGPLEPDCHLRCKNGEETGSLFGRADNGAEDWTDGWKAGELKSGMGVPSEERNGPPSQRGEFVDERDDVQQGQEGEQGLWSIVIPTYNRLPILTKCLQALEEQEDYHLGEVRRFEVVVVDDGSTDGTVEFLTGEKKPLLSSESSHEITSESLCGHGETVQSNASRERPEGRSVWAESRGDLGDSLVGQSERFAHVKVVRQKHAGATKARNLGLKYARGAIIVFIDSDLVVTRSFLKAHGEVLREAFAEDGDDRAFTYGCVINTSNFENPFSEKYKITDYSAAFFATGNVAISRRRLLQASKLLGPNADGPFDVVFSEYGWEDLELGGKGTTHIMKFIVQRVKSIVEIVRLKECGARIKHAPAAIGYHWHPIFSVENLPKLIEQERQRGCNGVRFYQKHPNLNVRLMIQMTPFHELLWFLLTLGGLLNEKTLYPLLHQLEMADMHQIAAALVSPILNWHTVQAVKEEARKLRIH